MLRPSDVRILLASVSIVALLGCGGHSSPQPSPPQFTFASGNWTIFLPPGLPPGAPGAPPVFSGFPLNTPFAGGQLVQNGNAVSGTLFVTGLSCFDPVADPLIVKGTFGPAGTLLTFSTAPVRGQVLTFNGSENFVVDQCGPCENGTCCNGPPSPVKATDGSITISGGTCAGTATTSGFLTDFTNSIAVPTGQTGVLDLQLSQTGPDAQGVFHLSGKVNPSTPCFTSGTITGSSIAGELTQFTITTDNGQLNGTGQIVGYLNSGNSFTTQNSMIFTMQGGPCDGQTFGR